MEVYTENPDGLAICFAVEWYKALLSDDNLNLESDAIKHSTLFIELPMTRIAH